MKKSYLSALTGILAIVCLFGASAHAANLRFNVMYNQQHPLSRDVFEPWGKKVKEATDNRVKVTFFYSNALFAPKDGLDAVASRVADVGIVMPSYTRNRLLMNNVADLPMVGDQKAEINSQVLWELYTSVPEMQEELKDVKVLWAYMNPALQLHFTKKQVTSVQDLQNMVISSGGPTQSQILRLLGASPETIPMVEVFMALQTGVVEGCFLPYAPLRTQKISDLTKFHTNADLLSLSFYIVMNKKVWDKLSAEDRKAIDALSGMAASRDSGLSFDRAQAVDVEWMGQNGSQFYTLTEEQRKAWAEKIMPIRQQWIDDARAKGYKDPEAVLKKAVDLVEQKRQK